MLYRDRLLSCPRCGKPLERAHRRDRWRCRGCEGVVLEITELAHVLVKFAPDVVPAGLPAGLETASRPATEPPLTCAACAMPMAPVALHGVALDRCYRDQLVWFDATKLDAVIDEAIEHSEARKGWVRRLRDLLFAN